MYLQLRADNARFSTGNLEILEPRFIATGRLPRLEFGRKRRAAPTLVRRTAPLARLLQATSNSLPSKIYWHGVDFLEAKNSEGEGLNCSAKTSAKALEATPAGLAAGMNLTRALVICLRKCRAFSQPPVPVLHFRQIGPKMRQAKVLHAHNRGHDADISQREHVIG